MIHWIIDLALLALLFVFMLDGLTFLWVRRVYQIVYRFVIKTNPHCIIMADVDDFKSINDRFKHRGGDQVLRKVGLLLLKECKGRAFRYGGEEFIILLPWTNESKAFELAERIRQKITTIKIGEINVTVSIGIGNYEEWADKAMYMAKSKGKNRIEIFKKPG